MLKGKVNRWSKLLLVAIITILIGLGGWWIVKKTRGFSQKTTDDKVGFLTGAPPWDAQFISKVGASWVRPHVGPFLWDSMQSRPTAEVQFTGADKTVKEYQAYNLSILVTLWPFANWDQKNHTNSERCKVSDRDQFLPDIRFAKDEHYLPQYRCNPADWNAYQKWVEQVVERYDGDKVNDMPGLKTPIKYWEVMNEPDLTGPEEESDLNFYQDGPEDYAQLLIKTSQAIRQADPEAKILIAGAAGGGDEFVNFYREVFENKEAIDAFDIANVHCISNDDYQSFNVAPYQKVLQEFGINKPIWVTEAEAIVSDDPDVNATQTLLSTEKALGLGAEKIFYTRYEFGVKASSPLPPKEEVELKAELDGKDPQKAYREIINRCR